MKTSWGSVLFGLFAAMYAICLLGDLISGVRDWHFSFVMMVVCVIYAEIEYIKWKMRNKQ